MLTFGEMEKKLPIRRMLSLVFLMAIIVNGIVYFAFSINPSEIRSLPVIFKGLVSMSLVGVMNIGILVWLKTKYENNVEKIKLFRYLSSYPLSLIIYLLVFPIFTKFIEKDESWSEFTIQTFMIFVVSSSLVNTMVTIVINLVMLQNEKMNAELELSKIKTAHAEAEILLLRQQIHPHFLFNALNTLKSLYKVDTKTGDTYMVHLANFLRASIFDRDAEVSSLQDELRLLNDYLEMQKIRFGTAITCTIDTMEADGKDLYLPSFSLQPLLENAIKHNELTEELPLNIEIQVRSGIISVSNNLQPKTNAEQSTNSGLANLSERCKLLSDNDISISMENGKFIVGIKLLTNEYSNHRR